MSHPVDALVHNLSSSAWNLTLAKGLYLDEHEVALAEATIKEAIQGAQAAIETHHAAYEARWRERQRRKGINP